MLRHRLLQSGISCKSCNNFFPPSFRLTGPTADLEAIERYAELALGRAGQLGVEHVVFGSGPANRIPEGFAYDAAWTQLVELLHRFQPIAAKHGIRIAIEPLRRAACSLANIKLLADVFHMAEAGEELDVLLSARGYIEHIHIANPSGRLFPKPQDAYDYGRLFRYLREIGYQGKISVEAYTSNFYPDAADSLALLRNL
jgi:sugar phosphate isomerase/epimerase